MSPKAKERMGTVYRKVVDSRLTTLARDHWGKGLFGTIVMVVALWPQIKPVATDMAEIVRSTRVQVSATSNQMERVWQVVSQLRMNDAVQDYRLGKLEARP